MVRQWSLSMCLTSKVTPPLPLSLSPPPSLSLPLPLPPSLPPSLLPSLSLSTPFLHLFHCPPFSLLPGLKVRSHKGTKTKDSSFDYVHATFSTAKTSTDWLKLVSSSNSIPKNIGNHICLHDLKKKDKTLSLYDSLLRSPQLKALVLVNTCNSYKIPKKYRRKTDIPVVIVTEGTGQALSTVLKECKGNAEAMLREEVPIVPIGIERYYMYVHQHNGYIYTFIYIYIYINIYIYNVHVQCMYRSFYAVVYNSCT